MEFRFPHFYTRNLMHQGVHMCNRLVDLSIQKKTMLLVDCLNTTTLIERRPRISMRLNCKCNAIGNHHQQNWQTQSFVEHEMIKFLLIERKVYCIGTR